MRYTMDTFYSKYKNQILNDIESGRDFSPKGSIDLPIYQLISFINELQDYVTTSSCSGRISIFRNDLSPGSKGINWILVRHSLISIEDIKRACTEATLENSLLTILKCEGCIIHIQCKDLDAAKILLDIALASGFRESGISIGNKKIILAIRTSAFGLELPIAKGDGFLLTEEGLGTIVDESNLRLKSNFSRVDRLLNALKLHFGWPYLKFNADDDDNNNNNLNLNLIPLPLPRWGHSVVTSYEFPTTPAAAAERVILCMGGYGIDHTKKHPVSLKNQRELPLLCYTDPKLSECIEPTVRDSGRYKSTDTTDRMHSSMVPWYFYNYEKKYSGILIIGGRKSPQEVCLPFLSVMSHTHVQREDDNSLESSSSSSSSSSNSGSNSSCSFLLDQHVCIETGEIPKPRWGHTLTAIGESEFFLYGGRDHDSIFGDAYLLTLVEIIINNDSTIQSTWCWKRLHADDRPRFFHAACKLEGHSLPTLTTTTTTTTTSATTSATTSDGSHSPSKEKESPRVAVCVQGGLTSLRTNEVDCSVIVFYPHNNEYQYTMLHQTDLNLDKFYRFGHTITDIGFKTIIFLGGSNFDESSPSALYEPFIVLNYFTNKNGYIEFKENRHKSNVLPGTLPCANCRVHHQVIFNNDRGHKELLSLGGGALCLAFGGHFCQSLRIQVSFFRNSEVHVNDRRMSASVVSNIDSNHTQSDSNNSFQRIHNLLEKNHAVDHLTQVLLIEKNSVKKLKIFLEENNWYDNSVRISPCIIYKSYEEFEKAVVKIVPLNESLDIERENIISYCLERLESYMAVPVLSSFECQFKNHPDSNTLTSSLSSLLNQPYLILSSQDNLKSKSQTFSRYNLVSVFIEDFCKKFPQYSDKLNSKGGIVPLKGGKLKLEVVGDVLMIPSEVLCISPWDYCNDSIESSEQIEKNAAAETSPSSSSSSSSSSLGMKFMLQELWRGLALCFGVSKVARKAEIDSGPKRESKVKLLLPPIGVPATTGPGSEGWVTVVENSIHFSFDITRIMFCSGNCTERMRMAKVISPLSGEVVVDLYAGVGYYTLPFLVYGNARHVHACEWNDNSVLALTHNLKKASVIGRCSIYHSDNRSARVVETLSGVANRVCLGLLPSSEEGWPLAASALSASGGFIHVHENVKISEIENKMKYICSTFEELFLKIDKPLKVKCVHVERVKSYAPKVLHIVFDLECYISDL